VSQSATAWARSAFVGHGFSLSICWPRHDKVKTPKRGELCLSDVMNVGVPTQRQRQVRCQRCRADLLKLPHDCRDCMTFGHRLLRVYKMISGANRSGNDIRFATHSGVALDIAPCPKWPSRPGEFHLEPLTDPDLTLSRHPARATARRLPPSVENWSSSCCQLARSQRR